MIELQQTIAHPVSFIGKGLHTGKDVSVTLIPENEDTGIYFKRTDLAEDIRIKADCDLVVDVSRGTTLEYLGHRVSTIEHLMSAIVALGIDNLTIEVNGPEIPILDGSAAPFVQIIQSAGLITQQAEKEVFVLDQTFHYYDSEKDVEMTAIPSDQYSITVMIDFDSNVIGRQYAQMRKMDEFVEDFASARTFCFLHEVETLYAQGLIKGGELNNAIVISEKNIDQDKIQYLAELFQQDVQAIPSNGIVNNIELRYENEMARHKLLDVIGDLSLIGTRIKGKIIASKPGHAGNIAFAQKLKKYIKEQKKIREIPKVDPNEEPILDLTAIKKILPHRIPFLMIDKVIDLTENTIVGVKNVTINEPFFEGHFPENPVVPGVLQIEAMAQTGGILALKRLEDSSDYLTYLVEVEHCKFRAVVHPGDTMIIQMKLIEDMKRGFKKMKGAIYVGKKLVTEAVLIAKIFKP